MWRIPLFVVATILACSNFGCSAKSPDQDTSAVAVGKQPDSVEIAIGNVKAIFRKISPPAYKIDYPEFYLLETEVTNRMFREYLRATGKRKDDVHVLEILRKRHPPPTVTFDEVKGIGSISGFSGSTGDIPYQVRDEKTIWRDGNYPGGLDDRPVALVTLPDATAFCQWLSKTYPDRGLFRLPTWNEWMIAAYGSSRAYPWGDKWDRSLTHAAYGSSQTQYKKHAEPVKARPKGRTPEGLYAMLGNVSEYLVASDPTAEDYFLLDARWMGGGFSDGETFGAEPGEAPPREDYWGYSHHAEMRVDDVGFRVLLDVKKDRNLLARPRLFQQKNNAWRTKSQ